MTGDPRPRTKAFRFLLRVYPAWFREAHGSEMEQLYRSRRGRTRGAWAAAALWIRLIRDATATRAALRRRNRTNGQVIYRGGFDMWSQDIRYATRQLTRTPAFTLGAVALLAVGIGANVAVFTVVDAFLIRPLPYARPAEVVHIYQDDDDGEPGSAAYPAYQDMAALPVFSAVAATSPARLPWDQIDGSTDVSVEFATASYLDVAGLAPLRGRWFSREHDAVGAGAVAVVSAAAWRQRFGGDPGIVGRTIRLNGQIVTIIGVGPASLSGSFDPVVTDFWLSISSVFVGGQYRVENLNRREDHWYEVRARLASDSTPAAAQAAMNVLAGRLAEEHPRIDRGRNLTVRRAMDVRAFPESATALTLASALVLLLLVLTGANLANLLLVRGIARSGEVAVRRALGAGAASIGRLFLVESLLLSVTGGAAGIALAHAALAALPLAPLPPPFSNALDLAIDSRAAVFAVALMVTTGLLFGLAPAMRSAPVNLVSTLRDDRRMSSMGRGTMRLRNALVVVQVAGSLVLILAAGLLGRTLVALQSTDPGVNPERVAYVRPNFSRSGLPGADVPIALDTMRDRIAALPGVTHAATALRLPAERSGTTSTIIEGYAPIAGGDEVELNYLSVSPQYFETVGLRLTEGRLFSVLDTAGTDRVVLVNETAARRFWPNGRAIGGRMRSTARNGPVRTVVGIVEDAPVAAFPEVPVRPMFYNTSLQAPLGSGYILARTDGDSEALIDTMRGAVTAVRPVVGVQAQGTLASHFGAALAQPRFLARVFGSVSFLAVLLAGLGIYAVVAFSVACRAGEMGIRMALGASAGQLVCMVVGETVATVVVGLVGGIAIAVVAVPRLKSLLFGVEPLDVSTFGAAVVLLCAVASTAAYLPARRAARTDPARAFRE